MQDERSPEKRTTPAQLVIVDDHHLLRRGFGSLLASEPDLEVVGEAADGREAIELCQRLRPDFVLMDVRMPKMDGLAATREIKREHPNIVVLIMTMHENTDYLLEALDAGAAGYVLKDTPADRLISAVRRTLNGESPFDQELAARLLRRLAEERMREAAPIRPEPRAPLLEPLTPRELEVLGLLATGQTNRQIAQTLVISKGTVKVHVERIIRKLNVSDRTQAAVRAIEMGLLIPEGR